MARHPRAIIVPHGQVMLLGEAGDPSDAIIDALVAMDARRDVRFDTNEIARLLQRGNANPLVLHTFTEQLLSGRSVVSHLCYGLITYGRAMWWQTSLMNGSASGGGSSMIMMSSTPVRDNLLTMLRAASGGVPIAQRQIVPRIDPTKIGQSIPIISAKRTKPRRP